MNGGTSSQVRTPPSASGNNASRGSGGITASAAAPTTLASSSAGTAGGSGGGGGGGGSGGVLPTSSSSSSGFFRQRNGSGILSSGLTQPTSSLFERFRRPRTATSAGSSTAHRQSPGPAGLSSSDRTALSTDDLPTGSSPQNRRAANSPARQAQPSNSANSNAQTTASSPNGLPRSSSASHVHLPASNSNNSVDSPGTAGNVRRPGFSHATSQSHSNIRFQHSSKNSMGGSNGGGPVTVTTPGGHSKSGGSNLGFPLLSRSGSSQGYNGSVFGSGTGNGGSSSGFSRMFRRYSHGAGKNQIPGSEAQNGPSGNGTPVRASESSGGPANDSLGNSSSSHNAAATNANSADYTAAANAASERNTRSADTPSGGGAANAASHEGGSSTPDPVQQQQQQSAQSQSHRIRFVPHLEATRSLHFEPIERDLVEGAMAVKIGRFTDRGQAATEASASGGQAAASTVASSALQAASTNSAGAGAAASSFAGSGMPGARGGAIPSATGGAARVDVGRIAFKSKVVSRGHAEIWCEGAGKVFVRDTKSSSGTFLNHIRLSAPNVESKPFQIKDGDVIQLGVDYQGGTEEIYRCVKMRIELNRGWQRGANQFNVNALRQLRALQGSPLPDPAASKQKTDASGGGTTQAALPTNRQSLNVTDCCICLFSVTVCQALFIAPCSHVFHYKCIRPLLNMHHPGFSCPLCRTFADLEADVEEDEAWQQALLKEAGASSHPEVASTPMNELPVPSLVAIAVASSDSSDAEHFHDADGAPQRSHSAAPSTTSHHDQTVVMARPTALDRSLDSSFSHGGRANSSADDYANLSQGGRQSATGRRSESHERLAGHRDSPLRRPDTAVSSSTAVPASASAGTFAHAARTSSPDGDSRHVNGGEGQQHAGANVETTAEEETQEMLHEDMYTNRNNSNGDEDNNHDSAAAMYDQGRRPSVPINISSAANGQLQGTASPFSAHALRHTLGGDGFVVSPGLSDSRTPQNDHFLSTLAEPPSSSSSVRSALR